jgi:hypothetical protein
VTGVVDWTSATDGRHMSDAGVGEGSVREAPARDCCPEGAGSHHHRIVLTGIVTRAPELVYGDPTAFCDVGVVMSPEDNPATARYFRLVGSGADAKTLKRCLAIGCSVTFDGVVVHTGPPGGDGKRRGSSLGAGEVSLHRSARADNVNVAERGGWPLLAVLAETSAADAAPLSLSASLSLIEAVVACVGPPGSGERTSSPV